MLSFRNYWVNVRLNDGQSSASYDAPVSADSAVAIRRVFAEAFMDPGIGGFPTGVPIATLIPLQFSDHDFNNPTVRIPWTRQGSVPNNLFPTPPDILDYYWSEFETYFHLARNRPLRVTFVRSNTIRSSIVKLVFTIEI